MKRLRWSIILPLLATVAFYAGIVIGLRGILGGAQ